jgi:hypothetical protein
MTGTQVQRRDGDQVRARAARAAGGANVPHSHHLTPPPPPPTTLHMPVSGQGTMGDVSACECGAAACDVGAATAALAAVHVRGAGCDARDSGVGRKRGRGALEAADEEGASARSIAAERASAAVGMAAAVAPSAKRARMQAVAAGVCAGAECGDSVEARLRAALTERSANLPPIPDIKPGLMPRLSPDLLRGDAGRIPPWLPAYNRLRAAAVAAMAARASGASGAGAGGALVRAGSAAGGAGGGAGGAAAGGALVRTGSSVACGAEARWGHVAVVATVEVSGEGDIVVPLT